MSKAAKIILCVAIALIVLLAGAFCVEYFVLQSPVFSRGGWHTADTGAVQYCDYYGKPLTGWQSVDGSSYYFSEDGTMATGWQTVEGKRLYFGGTGVLQTGWLKLDGKSYYLKEDGTPYTGWLEEQGKRRYFNEDGVLQTGWLELDEGTYQLDDEGYPMTGWIEHEGLRYYFEESGLLNTNWRDTADGLTYEIDGKRHTGWLDLPEGKFYFNADGLIHTGWVTDETGRFYVYGDGTYATGFVEIDGVERYFLPTGEYVLLCNRWNPVPEDYAINLAEVEDGYKMDATCAGALQEMMAAGRENGYNVKINSSYRSKATQQAIWNEKVNNRIEKGQSKSTAEAMVGKSVAIPGTSEHQTGLAVDIKGTKKMYDWLAENSWQYGFILRYPDDKIKITGIVYEPWHFRYVGKPLAKDIYDSGLCLEEYLENLKTK